MNKNLKVFKFGGASVKDAASIKNVLDITNTFKEEQLVIVVSAMAKTTNNLEKIVDLYTSGADAFEELEKIKQTDVLINLSGEGIADKPWSSKRKKELLSSRFF